MTCSINSVRHIVVGLLLGSLAAACTTTTAEHTEEGRHAPLIVARSGDVATLSWQTQVGELYTILYADGRRVGVDWRPLPGVYRVPGNGQEMRMQDQMTRGVVRYYRLLIEPAAADSGRAPRR